MIYGPFTTGIVPVIDFVTVSVKELDTHRNLNFTLFTQFGKHIRCFTVKLLLFS